MTGQGFVLGFVCATFVWAAVLYVGLWLAMRSIS